MVGIHHKTEFEFRRQPRAVPKTITNLEQKIRQKRYKHENSRKINWSLNGKKMLEDGGLKKNI